MKDSTRDRLALVCLIVAAFAIGALLSALARHFGF